MERLQALCAMWGKGNERKRRKVEAVTIRAEAIIRRQRYCVYSAHDNLRGTEMFYRHGA